MNKRAFLFAFGTFALGLLLGVGGAYFCGMAYSGKQVADGLALMKEMQIADSGRRAFAEYTHGIPQVAIYALNQYLDSLRKAEELAGANLGFMTKGDLNFDMMLAHARLAKVYAAAGQPDRSTQSVVEALVRASRDEKLRSITNEIMLREIVARIDKGATK